MPNRGLEKIVFGHAPKTQTRGDTYFMEGKVRKVTSEGIYFIIEEFDEGKHLFGPSPFSMYASVAGVDGGDAWGHTSGTTTTLDIVGYRCLAMFSEIVSAVSEPWVLGVWPE